MRDSVTVCKLEESAPAAGGLRRFECWRIPERTLAGKLNNDGVKYSVDACRNGGKSLGQLFDIVMQLDSRFLFFHSAILPLTLSAQEI